MSKFVRSIKRATLTSLVVAALLATSQALGPFEDIIEETGLLTDVPESVNATITALQEELEPVVTGLLSSAGVPEQCVIDAYHFAVGCTGDILRIASNERDAIMSRASANPMMLFQPTSWTVISAADAQLADDAALFQITDTCCEELTKMNGACLCDPLVSSVIEPIAGRTFLDRVRSSYSAMCGGGKLLMYPDEECTV
jgi:hypothetical protein